MVSILLTFLTLCHSPRMQTARRCGIHYTIADIEVLAPAVLIPWQAVCGLQSAFGLLGYVVLPFLAFIH
jgi:hypothetical protein